MGSAAAPLFAVLAVATVGGAQGVVAPPDEPYLQGKATSIAKLGYTSFGPFPLGTGHGSAEVDQLAGEGVMRWIETAHFRIGCGLEERPLPEIGRKSLYEATKRLRQRVSSIPAEPARLDPWLQAHVLALRAEEAYGEFARMLGVGADYFARNPVTGRGDGPYLGCREKFVLLVFQRKSDLGRYLRSHCDTLEVMPWTHRWTRVDAFCLATSAECFDNLLQDTALLHAHVVHGLVHNFIDAFVVHHPVVPWWWRDGVGHWFARKVDVRLVDLEQDVEVLQQKAPWDWRDRARLRARSGSLPEQRHLFTWYDHRDRKIADHVAAWSLVDFLIAREEEGFGRFLREMRERPMRSIYAPPDLVVRWHAAAIGAAFGMDLASVDARWRKAVLAGDR